MPDITTKHEYRIKKTNSLLCVGLDPDFDKIPEKFKSQEFPQFEFCKWIIDETAEFAAAFKPNTAFFEACGEKGWKELQLTALYLKKNHPDIFTICDAKRADIGNTNNGYVKAIFDDMDFDAITLHPFLGKEALKPFLDRTDKISIILCHTSNPGSGEFQDLEVFENQKPLTEKTTKKVWQFVAEKVSGEWNANNNCMLVVGATYPEELKTVRSVVGNMTLLVPGIGAQGGDVEAVVKAGLNSQKLGMIINSSRGIIFSDNPKKEAQKLRDEINQYR